MWVEKNQNLLLANIYLHMYVFAKGWLKKIKQKIDGMNEYPINIYHLYLSYTNFIH